MLSINTPNNTNKQPLFNELLIVIHAEMKKLSTIFEPVKIPSTIAHSHSNHIVFQSLDTQRARQYL